MPEILKLNTEYLNGLFVIHQAKQRQNIDPIKWYNFLTTCQKAILNNDKTALETALISTLKSLH